MSRIFDVSSSTGLGIEGYLTFWKDELGNHTLGTKLDFAFLCLGGPSLGARV